MNRLEKLQLLYRERERLQAQVPQAPEDLELRLQIVHLAQSISDLEADLTLIERAILTFDRFRFGGGT